ncbi:hypothetical protein Cob_v010831 [Colletotrichum orbiculare MAFF 240422]|uniref:Uncharacterized protein n=1 Tax=Colletotrichum orbiculare (strain 104-T / ATCC 96160 / CBS 514.97 / LARS 414 / MAFF 240422) TaxID=1213857 RepID=A0A484FDQ5_COLOR|nr:hypothetical protein Cob_v010831 [Colletotrichum orbiculare MAFF 240422]
MSVAQYRGGCLLSEMRVEYCSQAGIQANIRQWDERLRKKPPHTLDRQQKAVERIDWQSSPISRAGMPTVPISLLLRCVRSSSVVFHVKRRRAVGEVPVFCSPVVVEPKSRDAGVK